MDRPSKRKLLIDPVRPITFKRRDGSYMTLTEREKRILKLAKQGLSDYKIAHTLKVDTKTINKSHKSARKKLSNALADIEWANKAGVDLTHNDYFDIEEES